jgi:Flp pilus assembly pilin Flp
MDLYRIVFQIRQLRADCRGQDMIEYALLAGSIFVVVAGFLPPSIMPSISSIFSSIVSSINLASNQSS